MTKNTQLDLPKLFISIISCQLVGLMGTPFSIEAIPNWYTNINKPFFSPPNWIFGPVWTILYLLMGISVYLIWVQNKNRKKVTAAIKQFLFQLFLNLIWSPIFFGLRSPLLGLIVIVIMWAAILQTIRKFYPLSKIASYLLVPYLAWVSFATILNASIFILNY